MTNSIIAIKGNHFDKQNEIFEAFRYIDTRQDKKFDSLDNMYNYILDNEIDFSNRDIALRGIWIDNGWTIIYDPEMVNVLNDEALSKLSDKFNADVLTFLIQTTSGSFGFAKYNPSKQRYFFSVAGDVDYDIGLPLPEEFGLNINGHIFAVDILSLAQNFGINFDETVEKTYIAKQLGYNEELKKELEPFKSAHLQSAAKKATPWWKFW